LQGQISSLFSRGITHASVERYPSSLSHHVHKAKVYLPVDIAKALSVNPALVQKATEIFYTRDAIQLRVRNSPCCLVPSHHYPGSAQNDSLSSPIMSSADCSTDSDCVRSISRPEVLPTQNIRSLARKRRNSAMEMERSGHENRECCLPRIFPL
jgi:hypothetical protein